MFHHPDSNRLLRKLEKGFMGDEFDKELTLVDHDNSGEITIPAPFSSGIVILFTEKVMIHHRQVIFLQRKQRRKSLQCAFQWVDKNSSFRFQQAFGVYGNYILTVRRNIPNQ